MNFKRFYNKNSVKVLLLSAILFFAITGGAYAQTSPLVPCGIKDPLAPPSQRVPCTICHIPVLFKNLIDFIIYYVAIPLAGLMFGLCGFFYITSGGSPQRVSQAKGIFMSTLIGIAWVFGSWLVISQILFTLTGTQGFYGSLGLPWYQISNPTSCKL